MVTDARYWVIAESEFRAALKRVATGESVDDVLVEWYANSDHDYIEGDD